MPLNLAGQTVNWGEHLFLDENDYLDPFPFGFRTAYGTETILAVVWG